MQVDRDKLLGIVQLNLQQQLKRISLHKRRTRPRQAAVAVDETCPSDRETIGRMRRVRRQFRHPIFLPGAVGFKPRRQRSQPLAERCTGGQRYAKRQGFLEHANGIGEVIVVAAAVMTHAHQCLIGAAQTSQQQPPSPLQ